MAEMGSTKLGNIFVSTTVTYITRNSEGREGAKDGSKHKSKGLLLHIDQDLVQKINLPEIEIIY